MRRYCLWYARHRACNQVLGVLLCNSCCGHWVEVGMVVVVVMGWWFICLLMAMVVGVVVMVVVDAHERCGC